MTYDKLRRNPARFASLAGLSISEFNSLLPAFLEQWELYSARFTLKGKVRERVSYSRKTSKLPKIEDKLLFILSYLKNNSSQENHGAIYGMTQPQCNNWVRLLNDLLCMALNSLEKLPDSEHLRVDPLPEQ